MRVPLLSVQRFVFTRAARTEPGTDSASEVQQEVASKPMIASTAAADTQDYPTQIPGYFVVSTAPINTEDAAPPDPEVEQGFQQAITEIANFLRRSSTSADPPQLIVLIHGYNTSHESAETWYKSVFKYINRVDPQIQTHQNAVFIGYRWSSERMQFNRLTDALAAMPVVPRVLLRADFLVGLVAMIILLLVEQFAADPGIGWGLFIDTILVAIIAASIFFGTLFLSLAILRLSSYFRDAYRATNYGVPDLVELLRSLDHQLSLSPTHQSSLQGTPFIDSLADPQSDSENNTPKVKLTLIGHSMGGFVVTNAVRILSDVFDVRSIEKHPTPEIGKSFCLERLILASPDIPVLTIAAGRANFLSSSLRRFAEAHLFSNQGDIVLRIASTAANYFSFPARTRSSGYRLGNVAVRSDHYGIVNRQNLEAHYSQTPAQLIDPRIPLEPALKQLFVANLKVRDPLAKKVDPGVVSRAGMPDSIAALCQERFRRSVDKLTIADLFTYFDCTDYQDTSGPQRNPRATHPTSSHEKHSTASGWLSYARRKPFLGFWDYLQLTIAYSKGSLDVHGGYFQGVFSQQLIYRLAFLGFAGVVRLSPTEAAPTPNSGAEKSDVEKSNSPTLDELDQRCRDRGIKLLLSPLRYQVDVQQQDIKKAKRVLMDEIEGR